MQLDAANCHAPPAARHLSPFPLWHIPLAGKEAGVLEAALGIPVLRHREKKPAGSAEDMERHFG